MSMNTFKERHQIIVRIAKVIKLIYNIFRERQIYLIFRATVFIAAQPAAFQPTIILFCPFL